MKCGTTSLATQMGGHPEIFISPKKEPHFFSMEEVWARGLGWYEALFNDAGNAKIVGEASTTYTMVPFHDGVVNRIAETLEDVHFVYVVRHPIKRLISNYTHLWHAGQDIQPIDQMVDKYPQLVAASRYHFQIEQYLQRFPANRMLVLAFEDFVKDPLALHRRIYEFLGVDANFVPEDLSAKNVAAEKVRESSWVRMAKDLPLVRSLARWLLPAEIRSSITKIGGKPQIQVDLSAELHQRLVTEFKPEIQKLSAFVGRDFSKIWDLDTR
jgi:hypothetical protein